MPKYTVAEEIEMLADAGLLTERQAEAYVRRRIELEPGWAVAEHMDISESTLSGYISDAEDKIEEARETIDALGEIRKQAGDLSADE